MNDKNNKQFEKAANYSVLAILLSNTISTMARFKRIPKDVVMTKVYNAIKTKAMSCKQN